jgi:hypothetical protein
VAVAARPDAIDLGFWRAVLGYASMTDATPSILSATPRRCGCRSGTRTSVTARDAHRCLLGEGASRGPRRGRPRRRGPDRR